MQWDLTGSLLGDSPKESGTRREIVGKKTGGLTVRLLEVTGVYGSESPVPQNLGGGQLLTTDKPPVPEFFRYRRELRVVNLVSLVSS
ncbi:hypothetical protein BHE74_00047665, partial [Ensete ventricosum]